LTGGGAPWGIACDQAARIAAADINAKGGLEVGGKKYQIEVISYDDQFKTADAVGAYNRLVNQDGVKYMVVQTSNGATALKGSIESDKVIVLSSGYGAKVVDDTNHYLYRWYSAPRDYMPQLADWMKANVKGKTVAVLNPNIEGAFEQRGLANDLYKKRGFDVVADDVYEMSEKDFSPLLTKVIARHPDIIDLGSTAPATAGLIVRQARELGFKGQLFKSAGPGPSDIVTGAGKEASEGLINFVYADQGNAEYQRLSAQFRKNVNQNPNDMFLPAYDGIMVLFRAMQKAGTVTDTTKVRDAIALVLPSKGALGEEISLGGKSTYGSDQEFITTNYMAQIRDGVPVVIGKIK
jgi:branched-chain amino acid transport system substrate-binding protein